MNWPLRAWVTVGVPVLVVALVVVAALLVSGREQEVYPEGTPEAIVQAYYQALVDEDTRRVYEQFTPELQERCDPPGVAEIAFLNVARVVLDEVDAGVDEATVRVSVTEMFDGGPFASDESTMVHTVHLERVNNTWGIAEMPWPLFCVRKN